MALNTLKLTLTEEVLNKLLSGSGKKIGEESFNLDTEILDQGRKLKQTGVKDSQIR